VRPDQYGTRTEQTVVVQTSQRRVRLPVNRRESGARQQSYSRDGGIGSFNPVTQVGNTSHHGPIVNLADVNLLSSADGVRIAMDPESRAVVVLALRKRARRSKKRFALLGCCTLQFCEQQ
jgi:hypothetical protein